MLDLPILPSVPEAEATAPKKKGQYTYAFVSLYVYCT